MVGTKTDPKHIDRIMFFKRKSKTRRTHPETKGRNRNLNPSKHIIDAKKHRILINRSKRQTSIKKIESGPNYRAKAMFFTKI